MPESHSKQESQQETAYQIPSDPDHLLLEWNLSGGFRAPSPEGFERKPNLQIYADGRVIAGVNGPEYQVGEAKLNETQLKSLLDFIVIQQKFFETSEADIRRHMDGYRSRLADGLTSTIQIELEDLQQSVAVYSTNVTARDFKDYAPIQRIKAIEQKLRDVILFAKAGGDEGIEEIVSAVNHKVVEMDPNAESFKPEDLKSVTPKSDGSLLATLSARLNGKNVFATVKRSDEMAPLAVEIRVSQ